MPGSKLEQHRVSLPKVAVQIAEGREIGEAAGRLYQALSNGLLVAEAEIHRIYNEPIRGGEVFKAHLEWPRFGQLSRDWWIYGHARIDPPGTRTFEPKDPSVASVFSQLLEELAKEGKEGWELTLTKPYGNRAGGHRNDLDLATKIRIRRSDLASLFAPASTVSDRTSPEPYRSGLPGRPTAKRLIETEFERRAQAGEACSTLAREARALCDWIACEHPTAPSVTARTIENQIRHVYNRLVRSGPTK